MTADSCVQVGQRLVGPGHPCYVIAEIGINHNGSVDIARQLIEAAVDAGCDAVKFQKRTPELCVPDAERDRLRETPWGTMTYIEYKRRIELGPDQYDIIDAHCRAAGIDWFASCWDVPSVRFLERYRPPAYKVASATLTDHDVLMAMARTGAAIFVSTGMSTPEEVDAAERVLGEASQRVLWAHTTSGYPCPVDEINLRGINWLAERYGHPVGYSGHETGLMPTVAAVAMGACFVERHITLDRTMWGTDQSASVEPDGLRRLVRDIRAVEAAMGDGVKRVRDCEIAPRRKLRGK